MQDTRPAGELAPTLALPWVARLRWGLVAGEAVLLLLARFAFDIDLPMAWLALPLLATALSNFFFNRSAAALGWLLALDTVSLTVLLALSGGPANPFSLLYLVQITLSAVILSKQWTWALGTLSIAGFAFLFAFHVRVPVFEGHHMPEGYSIHLTGMWVAFAAAALLITVFIGKVSEALRRGEQQVLALRDRLARHERLASLVTLAAGAAHELSTPLATIAISSRDLELMAASESDVAAEARLIRAEVDRCSRILRQMSARGAEPAGEMPAHVELLDLLRTVARDFGERLRVSAAGQATLPVEATRQALTALVKNALDASAEDGAVDLTAEIAAGLVRFSVQDTGCGMNAETLQHVGEPFFTTKPASAGMGLGTFLVRVFAENLNGTLAYESEVGTGTKAILEIPQ